jgi:hypothetical protein
VKSTKLATLIATILLPVTLQASPIYRYEFWWLTSNIIGFPNLGEEGSGYIDFRTPSGTNVPILQAIADIQVRGFSGEDRGFNGPLYPDILPPIPAPTLSREDLDSSHIGTSGFGIPVTMSRSEYGSVSGFWAISHSVGDANIRIRSDALETFFPLPYDPMS